VPRHTGLLPGEVFFDIESGVEDADAIITLRLQKERMLSGLTSSVSEYTKMYQVNREVLKSASPDCLVLHPGPINRGVELDDESADSERSMITHQVENGIFVRMAALYWVFGGGIASVQPGEAEVAGEES
jgi:aspartate carbamoyltransferase catalytic subunit